MSFHLFTRRRRARAVCLSLTVAGLVVGGVSGCEFGSKDKADKAGAETPLPSAPAAAGSSAPAAGTPAGSGPPGSPAPASALTADQLKAALLTTKELPAGWTVTPRTADGSVQSTVSPAKCQPIVDLITGTPSGEPVAAAKETLKASANAKFTTDLTLARYADGYAQKLTADVQKLADAYDCLEFTVTNRGKTTAWRFQKHAERAKPFGDSALWLTAEWGEPAQMADPKSGAVPSAYVLVVRSGSTLIRFEARPEQLAYSPDFPPDAVIKAQLDKLVAAGKR